MMPGFLDCTLATAHVYIDKALKFSFVSVQLSRRETSFLSGDQSGKISGLQELKSRYLVRREELQ